MSLFKKKKFGSSAHGSEEMSLQITSMADIFTILLVFLLKSYSTSAINFTPSKDLQLPKTFASDGSAEAISLQVSENGIQIEGVEIVPLKDFKFEQNANQDTQSSSAGGQAIPKITEHLNLLKQKQNAIAEKNSDVQSDSRIIIIADQRVPYQTLKSVLASAALGGYSDFKLATFKE